MQPTAIAHLPLHGGRAPAWLFQRMVRLGREIVCLIIEDHGPEELLARIRPMAGPQPVFLLEDSQRSPGNQRINNETE